MHMWVYLRVEHLGQNTFQAFQKPMYLQNSFDVTSYGLFCTNLKSSLLQIFVRKELLSWHHSSLILYENFLSYSQSKIVFNIRNLEMYPHTQVNE